MNLRRLGVIATTLGLAATAAVAAAPAATAERHGPRHPQPRRGAHLGRQPFDRNWYDYDIVTEAVLAVLAAKPESPVGLLTDGTVPLTAFIPNDRAFQVLAYDLTKKWPTTEEKTFDALVAAAGVDAIEQVLLYHVVPGATITKKAAVNANGAVLTTAQGGDHQGAGLQPLPADHRAARPGPQRRQPVPQPARPGHQQRATSRSRTASSSSCDPLDL